MKEVAQRFMMAAGMGITEHLKGLLLHGQQEFQVMPSQHQEQMKGLQYQQAEQIYQRLEALADLQLHFG